MQADSKNCVLSWYFFFNLEVHNLTIVTLSKKICPFLQMFSTASQKCYVREEGSQHSIQVHRIRQTELQHVGLVIPITFFARLAYLWPCQLRQQFFFNLAFSAETKLL